MPDYKSPAWKLNTSYGETLRQSIITSFFLLGLQVHLMANKHDHSHYELIRNPHLPDSRKKPEHIEDETEVMSSLLFSVKDRVKIR